MTKTFRRISMAIGAAAVALVVAGAGYQHLSAQGRGFGGPGRNGGGPGGPIGRRGGPGGPAGPGMVALGLLQRLDLTSDQRDRVKQILDSHRDEQTSLVERGRAAHEALQDAVTGSGDESLIRAKAADVAAVEADMAVTESRVYNEVFQILTPEQQAKAKKLQADMKQRRAEMEKQFEQNGGPRGRGGRRGPGVGR